jgi:predicted aspartyl protease
MGMTTVHATLANVLDRSRSIDVEMMVDSGAIYSVVPGTVLRSIGVASERTEKFYLADGRSVRRRIGHLAFAIQGAEGISRVVFGRSGDACLLGMVTLEELGLGLDPLKRRLRPLRLMIA